MVKSQYQFNEKEESEKSQHSLDNKAVETMKTKKFDPFNRGPVSIWTGQHQLPELFNGNN